MVDGLNTSTELRLEEARVKGRRPVSIMFWPGTPVIDTSPYPHTYGEGDIQDLNQQFIEILEDLRRFVQRNGWQLRGHNHDYLKRLRKVGRAAYNTVLPVAARDHIARLDADENRRGRGLRLTLTLPTTLTLFWEMLYAGNLLDEAVEPDQFWGFRYPLGRIHWNTPPIYTIELGEGILSAMHSELFESRQEVEQLAKLMVTVCHKKLILLDHILATDSLTPEKLMLLLISDDFPYGIVHFACHCKNPQNSGASRAYLCLTAHGQELEVPLLDLAAYEDLGFHNHPFVFLNACETQTPNHLLQTINLPANLIKFRAGGVIATACTMPDNFASAFASEFYRRLLNRPRHNSPAYIAEVLTDTRLYFLNECNNPLGLAYGLYAISEQEFTF